VEGGQKNSSKRKRKNIYNDDKTPPTKLKNENKVDNISNDLCKKKASHMTFVPR